MIWVTTEAAVDAAAAGAGAVAVAVVAAGVAGIAVDFRHSPGAHVPLSDCTMSESLIAATRVQLLLLVSFDDVDPIFNRKSSDKSIIPNCKKENCQKLIELVNLLQTTRNKIYKDGLVTPQRLSQGL